MLSMSMLGRVSIIVALLVAPFRADAKATATPTLLELAVAKFRGKLTLAERELFVAAERGDEVNLRPFSLACNCSSVDDDPGLGVSWTGDREIHASRIAWLCTDRLASRRVAPYGIRISGARVVEPLKLTYAYVPFPLYIENSWLSDDVDIQNAKLRALSLEGSDVGGIAADGARIEGPVWFDDGFRVEGEVSLIGATIGDSLVAEGGQFINPGGRALAADGIKVEQSVLRPSI